MMGNLLYHKTAFSNCQFCMHMICQKIGGGMDRKQLFIELKDIQDRGITIFLEGEQSTPENVSDQMFIHQEYSYMRDYVYDEEEGVVKELHFDKVRNV